MRWWTRCCPSSRSSGASSLVIDDLHELNSPEAAGQLTALLTRLPPGVRAIVATRRDLPLGLHKLRLASDLAEIRAAHLRFTEPETRQLLDAAGIALPGRGRAAAPADRRLGGRAAARGALAGRTPRPRAVRRRVLRQRPHGRRVPDRRDAGAAASRGPGPAAAHLPARPGQRRAGRPADRPPGSERILLELADANAFVVPLDPERTWFRYHHLFGDLLRLELRRTLPEEVPGLHRRAAGWFIRQGQVVDAIRHTQAAGDWPEAARLLADHSFSLTLDGQAQTMQALVRAFPPGEDHPELALVRAGDLVQGRLDEAAAHLAVAETYAETAPPDRQRRLRVAIASLKLSLARRRGHLAGVIEQVRFLASPVTGQSDEDIALGSDLRAVALMNLGTVEAWSLGLEALNATSGRAPCWPGRSAGLTSRSAASHSSVSRRKSTRSPRPSGAAVRR